MTDYTKLVDALRYCKMESTCGECQLFETNDCLNVLHDDAADAIEALQAASPWHRVEDGLPKQGEWVLAKSCLVQMSTDFIDKTWRWYRTPGVTHWMPLPEPPKEDA